MTPFLSICIPTFNRAPLLKQCLIELKPVLKALPFETEVVVSDTGSTDETDTILAGSDLPGLRVIKHRVQLDPIANHFAAMRHARGEYVHYLGDDDALLPKGLIAAVEWLSREPGMVAAFNPMFETEQGTDRALDMAGDVVTERTILPRNGYREAFQIIAERVWHPEVPLVRAETWRRFVTQPRKTFYGYWLLASLLSAGAVGLGTEPYYKHRLRPISDSYPQIQWEFAVDRMDQNRLGMELLLLRYLQTQGQVIAEEQRVSLLRWFAQRSVEYAQIASRVSFQGDDQQAGVEFGIRYALWFGADISRLDEDTLPGRVEREIENRLAASPAGLEIVDTAKERAAMIEKGCDPIAVIAREDIAAALRVCHV